MIPRISAIAILSLLIAAVSAVPAPQVQLEFGPKGVRDPRLRDTDIATVAVAPVCNEPSVQLTDFDCNRAMLRLGGGIAKPIETLRVNGTETTGTFGNCRFRVTVEPGGNGPIGLSKGRLQAVYRILKAKCGVRPGTIVSKGGAGRAVRDNVRVSVEAVNATPPEPKAVNPSPPALKQPSPDPTPAPKQAEPTPTLAAKQTEPTLAAKAAAKGVQLEFGPNGVRDPRLKDTDINFVQVAPVCDEPSVQLTDFDHSITFSRKCNRALLSLGGGIGKPIEILRVNGTETTGTFGNCRFRVKVEPGGEGPIGLTKGRLQAVTRVLKAKCGVRTGSIVSKGGTARGNVRISVEAVNAGGAGAAKTTPEPKAVAPKASAPAVKQPPPVSAPAAKQPTSAPVAKQRELAPAPKAAPKGVQLEFGPNGVRDPRLKDTDINFVQVAPVCDEPSVQLTDFDCNRALLSLGGGIGKPIEILRVNGTETTGTFGNCRFRVKVEPGGEGPIGLTKGRLQAVTRVFKAKCGVRTGSIVSKGGTARGNVRISVEAVN
ncbi:hypothetical protein HDU96_010150 [Phlyctochytrium bullatum]|nr:hypothetical protein HDU96_010150 [Phlyctochytrium bullatum]